MRGFAFLLFIAAAAGQGCLAPAERGRIIGQHKPYTGALAEEFRKRLDAHPDDLGQRYLYALALIGKDTPAAIEALRLMPKNPWSYVALEEIYSSAAFHDPAKVAANLRAFHAACPGNLDGFEWLNVIQDSRDLREISGWFRGLLQKSTDTRDFKLWSTLWSAEFRLTPAAEIDRERKIVAEDVKRLEPLATDGQLVVLSEGYQLSGQAEEEKRIYARAAARAHDPLSDAIIAWHKEHPWSKDRAKELYDVSGEWVKKWPDRWEAWSQRRAALVELQSHSEADWKEVAEGILRSDNNGDPHFRTFSIAQDWEAAGVWIPEAVAYLRELLDWAESPAPPLSDLIRGTIAADLDSRSRSEFQFTVLVSLAPADIQLKDYAGAHAALAKLRKWLDTDFRANYEQSPTTFPDHEGKYVSLMARLAEAEGRKLDALAYYQQLITNPFWMQEYGGGVKQARALFKELGGSDAAFEVWSKVQPWPADRAEPPRGMATMAWNALNRALPEMRIPDYMGREWTLKDFKGKRTFVFLWATWCAPCWQELPGMQKLAEAVMGRSDVQAVSLTMDENPAIVEKFMKERHFDFPALVSKAYTEEVLPEVILGQVWLVDEEGRIRLQRQNGPYTEKLWVDEALDKLNHPVP